VQPFGAQLQLFLGPGGAEGAHRLGIHPDQGLANRIDIPRQFARILAPAWAGHRWIDQHQTVNPGRMTHRAAHRKSRTHGVADQVVAVQLHGLGESADVVGAGVSAVVQFRAG
jgi:hypothetical protein